MVPLIEVHERMADVPAAEWDALLAAQARPTPFMRHAWLAALQDSGCASPQTGWLLRLMTLREAGPGSALLAACALYLKSHSYGEYVFDFSWAQAHERCGLRYYPKAVVAVPFTPVPGSRLLARDAQSRQALLEQAKQWCFRQGYSSLHVLLGDEADQAAAREVGLMQRQGVQFHWHNAQPPHADFEAFLHALHRDKRKKIRQERRKVADAGVVWRVLQGAEITPQDWAFFYRCYERTYLEHGNPPYLSPAFFEQVARTLPDPWVLFVAQREGEPIACSLIAHDLPWAQPGGATAWGRYWGTLQHLDCLHFEACYYQSLQWCIQQGVAHFEGGAQGEHKMARALMPTPTFSQHALLHPALAAAVSAFLEEEGQDVQRYLDVMEAHSPLRPGTMAP